MTEKQERQIAKCIERNRAELAKYYEPRRTKFDQCRELGDIVLLATMETSRSMAVRDIAAKYANEPERLEVLEACDGMKVNGMTPRDLAEHVLRWAMALSYLNQLKRDMVGEEVSP